MLRHPRSDHLHLLHRYIILLQHANQGPLTSVTSIQLLKNAGHPLSRATVQRALSDMYALGILDRHEDRTGGIVSCTYTLNKRSPLVATNNGEPI